MKLTMLGTGNALCTECYNTCFIFNDNKKYFLIDAGGGNQILKQLKLANIDYNNIHDIFVTHKHIDHLMGIIWLIRIIAQSINKNQYKNDLNIYTHSELIENIQTISTMLLNEKEIQHLNKRIHLISIKDRETINIIEHKVTFFDINSTKTKQFGFCIDINGMKLSCCGDEPCNDKVKDLIINSDWLMHEAFCLYSQADIFKPYEKHHSTVKDACQLANELNIKNLILYHTEDKNIKNRKQLYFEEGKKYYKNNLYIPNDLDTFDLYLLHKFK